MTAADTLPTWPLDKAAEAVQVLADAVGWLPPSAPSPPPPPAGLTAAVPPGAPESLSNYLELVAAAVGLESELVSVPMRDLPEFVRGAAPALILLPGPHRLLAVVSAKGSRLRVLSPDGSLRTVASAAVVAALAEKLVAPVRPLADKLLKASGARSAARRQEALSTLLAQRVGGTIAGGFLLRLGSARPLQQLSAGVSLPRLVKWFAATHFLQYAFGLLMTYIAGSSALAGRIDTGWLLAGALLLASLVPLQLIEGWVLGRITIGIGIVLRQRLLWGALRLPLEVARKHGYGGFIGQTIESEAVEVGLRSGGLIAVGATVDLLGALWVTAISAPYTGLALVLWLGICAWVAWRYYRTRLTWTDARFALTGELLEKMLGHRTRLVQEPRAAWHRHEDQALNDYQGNSRTLDAWSTALWSGAPSGWLALGILSLAPLWLSVRSEDPRLALGIWGALLAFRAFGRLSAGVVHLVGAAIALRSCRDLLRSAAAPEPQPLTAALPSFEPPALALEASGINVRYGQGGPQVLHELSLRLASGQRLLLQGASGSGKSTLAAALTGLTPIDSGQLLLGGLDMGALGQKRWRRMVASAPQFHENHLFCQSLAFNLLIGRAWPPSPEDLNDAKQLCEELGLGPLVQRMPGGLFQYIGEMGWQLSHGEKSRVYIARTLLQRSQVVILDESFAALDPKTLAQALECVLRRTPTLVVIAHP